MHRAAWNRILVRQLNDLHAAQPDVTLEQIATELRVSTATVSRILANKYVQIPWPLLQMLMTALDASEEKREQINASWHESRTAGESAFTSFRDVLTPSEREFFESQQWADVVQLQAGGLVPAILRVPAYHRGLCGVDQRGRSVTRMLTALEVLQESHNPRRRLHVILDESVFMRRNVTGWREQMLALLEADARGVIIQVFPFAEGIHAGMVSPFSIMSWNDDPDATLMSISFIHEPVQWVRTAKHRFELEGDWLSLSSICTRPSQLTAIVECALRDTKGEQLPTAPR